MSDTTRRTVIIAGGAVGAAGLLAACGAGGSGGKSPTSASSSGGSAAPTTLGPASEVPVNGGKVYDSVEVVVTQPSAGQFNAFSAVCPHAGCLVSEVVDNVIVCPCHGSRFSASTGAVEQGPATTGLAPMTVKDSNGTLIL